MIYMEEMQLPKIDKNVIVSEKTQYLFNYNIYFKLEMLFHNLKINGVQIIIIIFLQRGQNMIFIK